MRYAEPGSWGSSDTFYKVEFTEDIDLKQSYTLETKEIPRADRSSAAIGLYGATAYTKICSKTDLSSFVFGGINTTFGGRTLYFPVPVGGYLYFLVLEM